MTTVNVPRSLLTRVIQYVADNVHAYRESESLPDGSIPDEEVRECVESEERMLEELRQALAPEQPSEQGDVYDWIGRIVPALGDEPDQEKYPAAWVLWSERIRVRRELFAYWTDRQPQEPPANDEATKCVCGQPAEFCGHCVTAVVRPNDEAVRLLDLLVRAIRATKADTMLLWPEIENAESFLTTHKQEGKDNG